MGAFSDMGWGVAGGDAVSGIMPTLRCANKECNHSLGAAHFFGAGGVFRIFECPKCFKGSEFENTPRGIVARPLPAKKVPVEKTTPTGQKLSSVNDVAAGVKKRG